MIPLAVLVLLAAPAADPLPDGKTIDGLTFLFSDRRSDPPTGSLSITADGKVRYVLKPVRLSSGGKVTKADWEIPKAEAAALLGKLVEDGLLQLREGSGLSDLDEVTVTAGRWRLSLRANPLPDEFLDQLRPYLEKAHPERWKKPAPKPVEVKKPELVQVSYSFITALSGPEVHFTVDRKGQVRYVRAERKPPADGPKDPVNEAWTIPAHDAAKLFDALVADGLFDLADTGGGKFPYHRVEATAGKWKMVFHPKELPEAVMKHLRPLLEKADPDVWKKK